jgi:D-alanyl-D-alanine carboxypeptidase/D-alanyl-D-alanine-endopeptidase (penicillin-binding protein 4)
MLKILITIELLLLSLLSFPQKLSSDFFTKDSLFLNASVSLSVIDAENGEVIIDFNSLKSLKPASVMKLITSAAALEILGPDYIFNTVLGYTGSLNERTGKLNGDIVITGGGDPAFGSDHFGEHYSGFSDRWAAAVKKSGIRKIKGRVITDDSRYDFNPVPDKWLWEDIGNYYGAGAFGFSFCENTYNIHLKTAAAGSVPVITSTEPEECTAEITNYLVTEGTKNSGYVFSSPYSKTAYLSGTLPGYRDEVILKASIADPPLAMAIILGKKLVSSGIKVSGEPSTARLLSDHRSDNMMTVARISSPPLSEIIKVMNHESINMYAEHLIKEMGREFIKSGTTRAGLIAVMEFLERTGINTGGLYLADGSGLSPSNAINSGTTTDLLYYMKTRSEYFTEFYASLPEAGKEGTLKNYFNDPVFESRMKAKSGSMTGVRSYAGYLTAASGREMIFSIIINNFNSNQEVIVARIEEFLKALILDN